MRHVQIVGQALPPAILLLAFSAAAQDSAFVPAGAFEFLSGEISGGVAYDHIRHLTLYHSPTGASQGFRDKLKWIAAKAREAGLQDIRIIDDLSFRGSGWTVHSAELRIVKPRYERLASFDETATMVADNSAAGEWTAELVDSETSTDVKGKIALVSQPGAFEDVVRKRGAIGAVLYNAARGADSPDQVAWTRIPSGTQAFGFSISYRAGTALKRRLAAGEQIVLNARVSSTVEKDPKQWIVEGFIRGKRRDQQIVLTAHGQEEKYSANDDNSGCASLLEIGRALTTLIRDGRLPAPERDIRFWWTNEINSEYEYFARHPEERAQILLDINQDMVGAKQSAGSRIQHITRTPWSRPSFLNDVIESVATMVMRGNSAYLAAGQAGSKTPYSKPILSHLGTRERYGVEIVPYFSNTDHMVFVDGIIGIPAVTLTNWPDEYIHSSDDDLWQIDPTQLQRNAFVVAATAWYFARLGPADVPNLVNEVHAGAIKRLAADFARASELLSTTYSHNTRLRVYLDGLNLIDRAAERENAAIASTAVFGPAIKLPSVDAAPYRAALAANFRTLMGEDPPPPPELTDHEKQLSAKVPEVAVSVADYIRNRARSGGKLHNLMAFETLNFVDGRRSYLDIYRAVRAEALAAGEWYYGSVPADAVEAVLDANVKAGVLRLKAAAQSSSQ